MNIEISGPDSVSQTSLDVVIDRARLTMKGILCVLLLLSLSAISAVGDVVTTNIGNNFALADEYQEHAPILIHSDADFIALGFQGSGTAEKPYLIENLMIVGPFTENQAAIRIEDVTASFVIRNCILYDTVNMRSPRFGIIAPSIDTAAVIEGNEFVGITDWGNLEECGIIVTGSHNLTITNNRITNCHDYGIFDGNGWLFDSTIRGNILSNCSTSCIRVSGGTGNKIENNIITDCQVYGIEIWCSNTSISGNHISLGKGHGIWINGNYDTVFNNTINDCSRGIQLGRECILFNNTMEANAYGMWLSDYADRSNVTWNAFVNNDFSIHNDANPVFFDYNYWSDYNGSDEDQNGIGDTPYENFFENVVDNHPLMYYPWYDLTTTSTSTTKGFQFQSMTVIGIGLVAVIFVVVAFLVLKRK